MYLKKLLDNTHFIAIWGLGYLGYYSLIKYSKLGIKCVLIDPDSKIKTIDQLKSRYAVLKKSYWNYASNGNDELENCSLETFDNLDFSNFSVHFVCVPVEEGGKPTNEKLLLVINKLKETVLLDSKDKPFIIIESSISPGTTENVIIPLFEQENKHLGKDYLLAVSPRRDWDLNPYLELPSLGRIIGSTDDQSIEAAKELLDIIGEDIYPVDNFFDVELSRCIENAIQYINSAFVNQLCQAYPDRNINRIMGLASTHPNVKKYLPQAGIGGFNFPMSSFFLSETSDFPESLSILLEAMRTDYQTIAIIADEIIAHNVSSVLILGLSNKANAKLHINSPAYKFIEIFNKKGVDVQINDPMYTEENVHELTHKKYAVFPDDMPNFDAVLILTPHQAYKELSFQRLKEYVVSTKIIFDTCEVWSNYEMNDHGLKYKLLGEGGNWK